jgi:hypothetical protein
LNPDEHLESDDEPVGLAAAGAGTPTETELEIRCEAARVAKARLGTGNAGYEIRSGCPQKERTTSTMVMKGSFLRWGASNVEAR